MSDHTDLGKLLELLSEIQGKLKAPALNGGFDTLMYKVEKIEEGQEKILERISTLNDTIYNPDTGLYARIKEAENVKSEELVEVEKSIGAMSIQHEHDIKNIHELLNQSERSELQIRELELDVKNLMKWKSSVVASIKWFLVTASTTAIGILVKAAYDVLIAK